MKKAPLFTATIILSAAATAMAAEWMQYDQSDRYRNNEASLDLFGSVSINQETINHFSGKRVTHDGRLGAGLGANFFFNRYVGIGGDAYSEDTDMHFVDSASGSLIGRLPIGKTGLAPYVFGGGGHRFDPADRWFAQVGAGLEFRFTPNVGIFADGRYVIIEQGTPNYGVGRAGLRLSF
jgi:opacity protein-like surface antigen